MGGQQANRIFRTLTFVAAEVDTKYETLVSKLTEYFIPQRNVIHERLQSRHQLANESVDEFARELQTIAVHCEYKEQTNEMVRARLVMGMRDQAVKQKLQLITDLSLDKAMTFATSSRQQVKLQMREQQLEQDQHVAVARVSPSPRTAGRYTKPKDRHTASKYRYSKSRSAWLESVNVVVTQNICAEGVVLRWDRGAISAMQKDILLLFVARSITL